MEKNAVEVLLQCRASRLGLQQGRMGWPSLALLEVQHSCSGILPKPSPEEPVVKLLQRATVRGCLGGRDPKPINLVLYHTEEGYHVFLFVCFEFWFWGFFCGFFLFYLFHTLRNKLSI